jgi:hypothetical protein
MDLLAKEILQMRLADISVAWIVPSTINTNTLYTQEKQMNIKESDMASMRALYDSLGVTEAAWLVLDGPSFNESYDGIHYPLADHDAGAQIIANAIDPVLPERETDEPINPTRPGSMAK